VASINGEEKEDHVDLSGKVKDRVSPVEALRD